MSTEDPLRLVPDITCTETEGSADCDSDLSQEGEEQNTEDYPVDSQIGESELQQQDEGYNNIINRSCSAIEIPSNAPQCKETVDHSTQTEHCHTKIYKEVSCECDLWSAESLQLKPLVSDISVQATSLFCTKDAITQTSVSHLMECGIQTVAEWNTATALDLLPSHSVSTQTVNAFWSSDSVQVRDSHTEMDNESLATVNASAQTLPDGRINKLEQQITQLKEELDVAQSTVVWQSLIIKLQKIETAS